MKKKRLYPPHRIFSMLFFLLSGIASAQNHISFGSDDDSQSPIVWNAHPDLVATDPYLVTLADTSQSPATKSMHLLADAKHPITRADVTLAILPGTSLSSNNNLTISLGSPNSFSVKLFARKSQHLLEVQLASQKWTIPTTLFSDSSLLNIRLRLMVSPDHLFSLYVAQSPTDSHQLVFRRHAPQIAPPSSVSLAIRYTKSNAFAHYFFRDFALSRQPAPATDHRADVWQHVVVSEVMTLASHNADYLELHNTSPSEIFLPEIFISHNGREFSSSDSIYLAPDAYALLSRHPDSLLARWPHAESLCLAPTMPSLAQSATLVVYDNLANVYDSVTYSPVSHSPVVSDAHDVALERVSTHSFASAAASSGYATPGFSNSHSFATSPQLSQPHVALRDNLFTPCSSIPGTPTQAEISFSAAGDWIVTIRVFSADGRLIASPADGLPAASQDVFFWDGRDLSGDLAPPATYALLVTAWEPSGRSFRKLLTVSLSDAQ